MIHDLTRVLRPDMPAHPGDPPYHRTLVASLESGDAVTVSALSLCAHTGTHLEAPAHVIASGKPLDAYTVDRLILPAVVRRIAPPAVGPLSAAAIAGASLRRGQALLLAGTDESWLSPELARTCAAAGLALVGVESMSVDPPGGDDLAAHRLLLGADVLVLEGLDLSAVSEGSYTLVCAPLCLEGAEAAPARVLLLPSALRPRQNGA